MLCEKYEPIVEVSVLTWTWLFQESNTGYGLGLKNTRLLR